MSLLRILLVLCCTAMMFACNQYRDEEHEKNVMIGLLVHEKYAELEKALAESESAYQANTISAKQWQGRWYGLANVSTGGMAQRFQDWIAATDSGHAYLLRGMYQQAQAWRGLEEETDNIEQQQQEFNRLSKLAETDILLAQKKLGKCILCLAERITANRALQKPLADSNKLLEEALALDPQIPAVVNSYLVSLYPQWGGGMREMRTFIDQMRTRGLDAQLVEGLESRYSWMQAKAALERNDTALALQWLQRGVNSEPYDVLMKDLAEAYLARDEMQKAVQVLELNLQKNNPWDLRTIDSLARTYAKMGQKEKSSEWIQKRAEVITRYAAYQ